jgi:hypothetical protein
VSLAVQEGIPAYFQARRVSKNTTKLTRLIWYTTGSAHDFGTDLAHDLPLPKTPKSRRALSPRLFAATCGRQAEAEGSLLGTAKLPPGSPQSRTWFQLASRPDNSSENGRIHRTAGETVAAPVTAIPTATSNGSRRSIGCVHWEYSRSSLLADEMVGF